MRVALAGDTMLGRGVAARLADAPAPALFSDEVAALTTEADLVVCNLECCISERGERWPDPHKPFYFRAPPVAVDALTGLGVDAVTLANNHALDYGPAALLDTIDHLTSAGIACVGAGADQDAARRPAVLSAGGLRVTPHWGPNMTAEPVPAVRAAGPALVAAGADLVAGHSAHVFHGVQRHPDGAVLYDLGDFVDDYAVHSQLRNDLGLLWLVDVDADGPQRLEAVPIALDCCFTRLADTDEAGWITERFRLACAALGTDVHTRGGRLVITLGPMRS